jgi:hypothetical protein
VDLVRRRRPSRQIVITRPDLAKGVPHLERFREIAVKADIANICLKLDASAMSPFGT